MKDLRNYINENKEASITDLIYESNFHAEDESLADLEPKMQDVKKFRLLVTRWDALGEEVPVRGDEHFAGNLFEKFEKIYDKSNEFPKDKQKVKDARNAFSNVYNIDDRKSKEYLKAGVKYYGAYIDALYSWAKKYATKGRGQDKWIDTSFIASTFLGLGSWIVNYGMEDNVADQLLGKLIKKFDKDMGKINGVEGLSSFLKMYDEKKVSMKNALDRETATLKSIDELKEERKKHKYTIIGGSKENAGAIHIYIFDNSKFETVDEIMESKPMKQDNDEHIGCHFLGWTDYDGDKLLRKIVAMSKTGVRGCYLCSGFYTYDNKDKDNVIPQFGFIDEVPKKVYKYSGYDQKFFYRGKFREEDYGYSFFDSLWSVPTDNE